GPRPARARRRYPGGADRRWPSASSRRRDIVELELTLEPAIGHSTSLLQKRHHPVEHLVEPHRGHALLRCLYRPEGPGPLRRITRCFEVVAPPAPASGASASRPTSPAPATAPRARPQHRPTDGAARRGSGDTAPAGRPSRVPRPVRAIGRSARAPR